MKTVPAAEHLEADKSQLLSDYGIAHDTTDHALREASDAIYDASWLYDDVRLTGTYGWLRAERDRLYDLHMDAGARREP